jgi:hypothetical protein
MNMKWLVFIALIIALMITVCSACAQPDGKGGSPEKFKAGADDTGSDNSKGPKPSETGFDPESSSGKYDTPGNVSTPPEAQGAGKQVNNSGRQPESVNASALKAENRERNENTVRAAVHNLLAYGNVSGGIGSQISEMASGFNNSVNAAYMAEEKIRNRNQLVRFLFGGDKTAAEAISRQVEENRVRIGQLEGEISSCSCSEETKAMLNRQVRILSEENARLNATAGQEMSDKGLSGFFL